MKTSLIRLLVVLIVVGVSVFFYDWFVLRPTREEQARTFSVTKVAQPTDTPLNYVAFA